MHKLKLNCTLCKFPLIMSSNTVSRVVCCTFESRLFIRHSISSFRAFFPRGLVSEQLQRLQFARESPTESSLNVCLCSRAIRACTNEIAYHTDIAENQSSKRDGHSFCQSTLDFQCGTSTPCRSGSVSAYSNLLLRR